MKILLTGKPGIGKTTILQKFNEITKRKTAGIYTEALKDENGLRVGFAAVNLDGSRRTLAHKSHFLDSIHTVGGKSGGLFFVDTDAISTFIIPAIQEGLHEEDAVIILDEIGKIQACDAAFLSLVDQLFASERDVLGTIVHDPEPWAEKYKNDPNVIFLSLHEENRSSLPQHLDVIFSHCSKLKGLDVNRMHRILTLMREYLANGQSIQIEKLFHNALDYIHRPLKSLGQDENGDTLYEIQGKHGEHIVTVHRHARAYSCTCPLNRGEEEYVGQAGECSHIQAVRILS